MNFIPHLTSLVIMVLAVLSFKEVQAEPLKTEPCPVVDDIHKYVNSHLTNYNGTPEGVIRVYYRFLEPFNPDKPSLLIINGGPGGDHRIIREFEGLKDDYNIVGFDHRGLGCTKIVSRHNNSYQPDLFSMSHAADDIEAIRRAVVGADGRWHVYGISYGGMLGQQYAIKYPSGIDGLILDSTFHKSDAIDIARYKYKRLFIEYDPDIRQMYLDIVFRYPEAEHHLLRYIWGLTYSYAGRTQSIKNLFERILAARDRDTARSLYISDVYQGQVGGMSFAIACEEIWDHREPSGFDNYYFSTFTVQCPKYKTHRKPMDWSEDLRELPVRTFIWAGVFDPVTPPEAMREMHSLIPSSVLFENPYAGHGLYFEKPTCSKILLKMFYNGASDEELNQQAATAECQSAPQLEEGRPTFVDVVGTKEPLY